MPAKIFYIHPCDIRATRKEKFEWLQNIDFNDIPFEEIIPDEKSNWINLTDNDFEKLLPLISKEVKSEQATQAIIKFFSNGVMTGRDEWVYDYNKKHLIDKVNFFIDEYNNSITNHNFRLTIKWSATLKTISESKLNLNQQKVIISLFRPFVKYFFYSSRSLNDRLTQNHLDTFGNELTTKNNSININF